LSGDRTSIAFLRTEFSEGQGRLSPDGRWMAYVSDETGPYEVYVQPFPTSGAKWRISTSGGLQPRWRRDGKELLYLAGDVATGTVIMAAEVRAPASTFAAGVPKVLFTTRLSGGFLGSPGASGGARQRFAVSPDGQRFLILSAVAGTDPNPITVVLNWAAGLRQGK
jgi:hypothetical protein